MFVYCVSLLCCFLFLCFVFIFCFVFFFFFFSSRRRHTRSLCDWSSDVCSSDLEKLCFFPLPRLLCPMRDEGAERSRVFRAAYRPQTPGHPRGEKSGAKTEFEGRQVW